MDLQELKQVLRRTTLSDGAGCERPTTSPPPPPPQPQPTRRSHVAPAPRPSIESRIVARLVGDHLLRRRNNADTTLQAGCNVDADDDLDAEEQAWLQWLSSGDVGGLEGLVRSAMAAEKQRRSAESGRRDSLAAHAHAHDVVPTLAGGGHHDHHVAHTHASLHPSNILVVRNIHLPVCTFLTQGPAPPRYAVTTRTDVLVTSGADRRLLLVEARTGDVIDAIEPVARPTQRGHTAPVLDVAQPRVQGGHARELVTAGMDGKVILWDLLRPRWGQEAEEAAQGHDSRAVQVLHDHARFVVRCVWSHDGQWLATAGYDHKICVYEYVEQGQQSGQRHRKDGDKDDDDPDDSDDSDPDDKVPPLTKRLRLAYTLQTRGNPETLLFVAADADADADADDGNLWLVWSKRDDCFLHYLCVPSQAVRSTSSPWRQVDVNTNADPHDTHVSYSILSLARHPTLPLLSLITGAHPAPAGVAAYSMLLLLPLLPLPWPPPDADVAATSRLPALAKVPHRVQTIYTRVPSSHTYVPRHVWSSDAKGVWISSDEGRLRLYDAATGAEQADVGVHGAAAAGVDASGTGTPPPPMSAEERAKRWRMGQMNGLIKDLALMSDGSIVTCGFDRTVRVVRARDRDAESEQHAEAQ